MGLSANISKVASAYLNDSPYTNGTESDSPDSRANTHTYSIDLMQDYRAGPWGTGMYYCRLCGAEHNVPPLPHHGIW